MQPPKSRRYNRELVALGILLVITGLITPISGVYITNNSGIYLARANSILETQSVKGLLSEVSHRPVLPFLLAASFKLFGKDLVVAAGLVRLFFMITVMAVYILGRELHGRLVGFLAALLTLSSYGINNIAFYLDTDIFLPSFVMLFSWMVFLMFRYDKLSFSIGAGLWLAVTVLVKEMAIVLVFMPFLCTAFSHRYQKRRHFMLSLYMVGTILIAVAVLIGFVKIVFGAGHSALDAIIRKSAVIFSFLTDKGMSGGDWWKLLLETIPRSIKQYYDLLTVVTPLAPVLVASAGFCLIRSLFYHRMNDIVLISTLICFLPIALRVAHLQFRMGQTAAVFVLLFVCCAGMLKKAVEWIVSTEIPHVLKIKSSLLTERIKLHRLIFPLLFLLSSLLLTYAQIFKPPGDNTWSLWHHNEYGLRIFSGSQFNVLGRFTKGQKMAADWLREHTDKQDIIVADGRSHEGIDFFLMEKDYIQAFSLLLPLPTLIERIKHEPEISSPIYVFTYSKFRRGHAKYHNRIYFVFQEHILEEIQKKKADYLVISRRGNYLRHYFNNVPWADSVYQNEESSIYHFNRDHKEFRPVPLDHAGVSISVRSGDGTVRDFQLTDMFKKYEIEGLGGQIENIYFMPNRQGVFYLDRVAFEIQKADGRWKNILSPADAGFETEGHWQGNGDCRINRIMDDDAVDGQFVLKVIRRQQDTSPKEWSVATLTAKNYSYAGERCRLTFFSKSDRYSFLFVNPDIEQDLLWLKETYPERYDTVLKMFHRFHLDPETIGKSSFILARGTTP